MPFWERFAGGLRALAGFVNAGDAVDFFTGWIREGAARRERLNELLTLGPSHWACDSSPAALLRGDFDNVRFAFRESERKNLIAWCHSDPRLALRLYTAPGGFGKTRLLREVCQDLRNSQWRTGFLADGLNDDAISFLMKINRPLLLVVDHAEVRSAEIQRLIAAARAVSMKKVRIVLLARSAGGWWKGLASAGQGVGDFMLGPFVDTPYELTPLTESETGRAEIFRGTIVRFFQILRKPVPTSPPVPDLSGKEFDCVKHIQLTALLSVAGETISAADLLDGCLEREERGFSRALDIAAFGIEFRRPLREAAVLITLIGGLDSRAATVSILRRVPALVDVRRAELDALADVLHLRLRGRLWCDGLKPAIVGEHLVAECLVDNDGLIEALFAQGNPESHMEAGLLLLNRLAQRDSRGFEVIRHVLHGRLGWLGALVLQLTSGDHVAMDAPLVKILAVEAQAAREHQLLVLLRESFSREVDLMESN